MGLVKESEIRDVHGITPDEKQRIIDFLQGAVYCWCKNKPDLWFSMRDLMGGDNYYWDGTPLFILYQKHIAKGKDSESAVRDAGIDSGWLLKRVLNDDLRKFDTRNEELINKYLWIREE
jgi:hypothetical protein